ncbi:transposase [Bradyrhizobium sp. i1.3.1]
MPKGSRPWCVRAIQADPFSGAVYVFRAKRADRVKLIYWDGTGVCLFAKRLETGSFCWPNVQDGVIRLTAAQLSALLEGLDWKRVHAARETPSPIQAS